MRVGTEIRNLSQNKRADIGELPRIVQTVQKEPTCSRKLSGNVILILIFFHTCLCADNLLV